MKIWLAKLKKIFSQKNYFNFLIYFLFFLGLILVFTFSQNKVIKPVYGGVYREGVYEPISSLNPLDPKNDTEKAILNIIYPPLIQFDNGKIISKFLVNYYFSPDKLTLTLEFKDNLKWSDGSKITTDDLLFSFDLYQRSNFSELDFLKNVELKILDQNRAEFHLKTNDNYFLYRLVYFRLLPAKIFAGADLTNFDKNLLKVGSGPFVFSSLITKGDFQILTLTKNNHFQPKPYLDKIEFYFYPSVKRAFDGLFLKEIDGLAGLNYFELPPELSYRYHIYKIVLPRVIGIFFNSQKVNKEVVSILNQNLNRQDLNNSVFKKRGEITNTLFSTTLRKIFNLPHPTSSLTQINKDLSQYELEIKTSSTYFYPEIARYLREKFKIQIEILDAYKLNQIIEQKDYQAVLTGLNFSHPPYLFSFFSRAGLNLNNLNDIELEKKFQDLLTNPQTDIYQKIQEIENYILKQNLNVFLVNPYYLYIINKKIKNFDQIYLFSPEARFVKIEYWYKEK